MILWLSAVCHAQVVTSGDTPQINAQTFRPTLDATSTLTVDVGAMPVQGGSARVLVGYHDDLLVYTSDDQQLKLVSSVLQANVMGAWGWGPARIGVDVPVLLFADGQASPAQTGLSDLSLDARVALFGQDAPLEFPVDLAVQGRLTVPTSTVDLALGSGRTSAGLAAVASKELGSLLLAANVGARMSPRVDLENVSVDDALDLRGGAAYALTERTTVSAELAARVALNAASNRASNPVEGLLAGSHQLSEEWQIRGGVGRGFTPGIGSPDLRLLVGVAWEQPKGDAPEELVQVPTDPTDQCPDEPEDVDGYEDDDGCPDPRTLVKLQVVDEEGRPVDMARGTLARTDDSDSGEGRPFKFRGGSAQIAVVPGAWRLEGRAPGFESGAVDVEVPDGAPVDVQLVLGVKKNAKVRVTKDRIELEDSVYFRLGSSQITAASLELLDQAATVLLDYPEIAILSVEGHTDSQGNDASNLRLSRNRAASVLEYLVSRGVDRSRLTSNGFGEERPLDPSNTPEAHALNRRVDFRILDWTDAAP